MMIFDSGLLFGATLCSTNSTASTSRCRLVVRSNSNTCATRLFDACIHCIWTNGIWTFDYNILQFDTFFHNNLSIRPSIHFV